MNYKIKSVVIGFKVPNWCLEPDDQGELWRMLSTAIIALYPKEICMIDSRLSIKRSYDESFTIISFLLSYYYDSDELSKMERNEIMEKFKYNVKEVVAEALSNRSINFQALES